MEAMAALGAGLFAILAAGYFLPFLIALLRGHRNVFGVFVLNLFLGWTMLGWIAALAWSLW